MILRLSCEPAPTTRLSFPLSFRIEGCGFIEITEYVGSGKFRGYDEDGNYQLYSWDDLKRAEIDYSRRRKEKAHV